MSAPAATTSDIRPCCLRGFPWEGTPSGTELTLPGTSQPAYVAHPPGRSADAGQPPSRAGILLVHDLFGWAFANTRLLADAYARETGATVYLPDFFGGERLPLDAMLAGDWAALNLPSFVTRNTRAIREPEIVGYARALRGRHERVGAVGFCFGGWAVFRLGAGEFFAKGEGEGEEKDTADGGARPKGLVDCIVAGHPTWLTKEDISGVEVPVQVLAPEVDEEYTEELKLFTFTQLQKKGVPLDYQHFPKVEHACFVRGDIRKEGERAAMERGKNAAVGWFRQWLHD
ncbi:Dienelactone hydrolase domain-containing protein [Madurella fahalii]|uniref:Dienelactone hydrolase domain-containing protein n=1 Tax=Madurella fahalii TaxID=1157608 RepID=A0ABQ0GAT5_9PEZI